LVNLDSKVITFHKKDEKWDSLQQNEYLNLPDLQFFLWCHQNFKLNRGVYNTIDTWFYNYGVNHIIHRRMFILSFLNFVNESSQDQGNQKFLRFGNGGLTSKLHQYMEETENVVH
jgi:riboflavin kinase